MIPRVFHQIWIEDGDGDEPVLPERYRAWRDSWMRLHPGWAYRLWNLRNLGFIPNRLDLIAQSPSFAQKADILRYDLLWRFGGVYLDVDFECLRPIDGLLNRVENFAVSENGRVLSIGIIGASAGSPYLRRCMDRLPERVGLAPPNLETGPAYFTQCLLGEGFGGDLTVLPSAWFYPYAMHEPQRAAGPFPGAYAVHHWAASWAPRQGPLGRAVARLRRGLTTLRQGAAGAGT
jgi:inositol phosphorylceramide mannosyltransferase catalytic subunit